MNRRRFLTGAGLAVAAMGLPGLAAGQERMRLAAIDWAMLETAMAIGHMPVAGAELIQFRQEMPADLLPGDMVDLGLRGAPNFELLQLVQPDLILSSPFYTRHEGRLGEIAPVLSLPFFIPGEPPLPKALNALELLADAVGDAPAGRQARRQAEKALAQSAAALAGIRHPICLVEIGDARHLRAFGFDSLFGSTLARLGIESAWQGQTEFSFLAPVPLERLADLPEAALVIIGPVPPEARHALSRSVLWRHLPSVAAGRVYQLPGLNPYGGTVSAGLFASALQKALLRRGPVATLV
ncbi:MAG: ABC transporter substrate-binding protein [Paracoccus sp. (in: a-proteobacteria)]